MSVLDISYAAFKIVIAGGAYKVYYGRDGGGFVAVIVSAGAQPSLRCYVTEPKDIEDFERNVVPDAVEVNEVGDALALVPLGLIPPPPVMP